MAQLCAAYWYPLYAYLRRHPMTREQADDLTQEFFAQQFVTGKVLQGLDATRGKFRAWLLESLKNLVRNEHDRKTALKRGGGNPHLPLDFFDRAEGRYLQEASSALSAEQLYEQTWVMTLLLKVRGQLRDKYVGAQNAERFEVLSVFLPGAGGGSQAEAARRLGVDANAVKQAVFRLRKDFGDALRAEITRTVPPSEVDEELKHLMDVCSW